MVLARMDQAGAAIPRTLVLNALDAAGSTENKLSILKRLRGVDAAAALPYIDRLARKENAPPVVLALIDFYIDGRNYRKAFDLFTAKLSCTEYPEIFAEIIIAGAKHRVFLHDAKLEDLYTAGIGAGQPILLQYAALKCMTLSNPSGAADFLSKAQAYGMSIPYELLWDAGLYKGIISHTMPVPDSRSLSYFLSASYVEKNWASVAKTAQDIVQEYPNTGWEGYLALGILAYQADRKMGSGISVPKPDRLDWPHENSGPDHSEKENAEYWLTEAVSRFPQERRVLETYIKWLCLEGRPDEGRMLLDVRDSDEGIDTLRLLVTVGQESSQRACASALELIARYPHSSLIYDVVLFTLFQQRSWDDFLHVLKFMAKNGVSLPSSTFYSIVSFLCTENIDQAVQMTSRTNTTEYFAYAYNLGILEQSRGKSKPAMEAMLAAVAHAPTPAYKVRSLLHSSYMAASLGDLQKSENLAHAALSLDPDAFTILERLQALYGLSDKGE